MTTKQEADEIKKETTVADVGQYILIMFVSVCFTAGAIYLTSKVFDFTNYQFYELPKAVEELKSTQRSYSYYESNCTQIKETAKTVEHILYPCKSVTEDKKTGETIYRF